MRMEIRKTSDRPAVLIAVRTSLGIRIGRGIGEDEKYLIQEKKQVSESVPKVQRALLLLYTPTHTCPSKLTESGVDAFHLMRRSRPSPEGVIWEMER